MKPLIVLCDNNREFLDTRAEFLEEHYRVIKAATLSAARQALSERHVHLAILDLRLVDDEDEHDLSGLDLARDPQFRSIVKVILTSFPTVNVVRQAMIATPDVPSAVAYVLHKEEGPVEMLRVVDELLQTHVGVDVRPTIIWNGRHPMTFAALVSHLMSDSDAIPMSDCDEEAEDLVSSLFRGSEQISMDRLLWATPGRVGLRAVVYGNHHSEADMVVVLGTRDTMQAEQDRYQEYALSLSMILSSPLVAETQHFAALAYPLREVGSGHVRTFAEFYQANNLRQIAPMLETLCNTTLTPWHARGRTFQPLIDWQNRCVRGLGQEESQVVAAKLSALSTEARHVGVAEMLFRPARFTLRLPHGKVLVHNNPLSCFSYQRARDEGSTASTVCGVTIGRLTSSAILVTGDDQPVLTDFGRVGIGPLVDDYVALEVMVHAELLDSTDLIEMHELAYRLAAVSDMLERIDADDLPAALRKAAGSIQRVRALAAANIGVDVRTYHFALFAKVAQALPDCGSAVRRSRSEITTSVYLVLLMGALCDRLIREGDQPGEGTPSPDGLVLDDSRNEVYLNGQPVHLTPHEYALVRFLWEHRERTCSRQAITQVIYPDDVVHDASGREDDNRLNVLVQRVRRKIEPDPAHPRYLCAERSIGYLLYPQGSAASKGDPLT